MKTDWFVADLGTVEAEPTEDQRALMILRAEEFLRVGRLTPADWRSLTPESKDIFLEASDRLDAKSVKAMAEGIRILIDLNGLE